MRLLEGKKKLHQVAIDDIEKGLSNIPLSVTHIGGAALSCYHLTKVIIPEGVTYIGDRAFQYCSNLTEVSIPDTVTHIGDGAFSYCSSLTKVSIPDGVVNIGECAFYNCSSLTDVIMPMGVTYIGESAFEDCSRLTQIIIPDGVTHIGQFAFASCSRLAQVIIPHGVTHIGMNAFVSCDLLTEVTIPPGVVSIGESAFASCRGLRKVSIPEGVMHIGNNVFTCSRYLRTIFINTLNEQEYQRISKLIPEDSRHLIMPYELWHGIFKAKKEAIATIKPIIPIPRLKNFYVMMMIHQMDENLYQVVNQMRLPRQLHQLEAYKKALKQALNRYVQKLECQHQKLVAIDKLTKYIKVTEQAITLNKHQGFFKLPENQLKLTETNARIAVACKLIQWLRGDENITFNTEEQTLLSHGNAISVIRQHAGISLEELSPSLSNFRLKMYIAISMMIVGAYAAYHLNDSQILYKC